MKWAPRVSARVEKKRAVQEAKERVIERMERRKALRKLTEAMIPKRLIEAPLPAEVLRGRGCLTPFDFSFNEATARQREFDRRRRALPWYTDEEIWDGRNGHPIQHYVDGIRANALHTWKKSLLSLCGTRIASMSNIVTDCTCEACLVQLDEGLAAQVLVIDEQKVLRWK